MGSGGHSDHFPIFFEVKKGPNNPPSPLKFNKCWLQEESFKNLFLSHWVPFGRDCDRSIALQFADNIKRLTVFIKEWVVAKRKRDEAEEPEVMVRSGMLGGKKIYVACDEFVIQSLILGALVDE